MTSKQSQPPEGGWGWMVVFATSLTNICVVPITTSFSLLFQSIFAALGLSHRQETVIMNTNAAFGMLSGLVIGAVMKKVGYRKVAVAAGFFTSGGVVLTSFANSFYTFIVFYGVISSLGMGMILSSYYMAINSYFIQKRTIATGLTMALTGVGSILMPQLIIYLLKYYSASEVILLIGAISGHSLAFALLLQPVKWHRKTVSNEQEELREIEELNPPEGNLLETTEDLGVIYGYNCSLPGSTYSLHRNQKEAFIQCLNEEARTHPSPRTQAKSFMKWIGECFDLELIKDPIFCNITLGMAVAIFAEMNFMMLFPFILSELGLTLDQSATCLSTLAISDVLFSFAAPYVGGGLRKNPRIMYMIGLCLLAFFKLGVLVFRSYVTLVALSSALGIARSIRNLYLSLVIPSYVPLEKFGNASGMMMMVNGIFILAGSPLLGFIRDVTGNYKACIWVINALLMLCVLVWTLEMLYVKFKNKQ